MNRSSAIASACTITIVVVVGLLALWPTPTVSFPGTDKSHHFLAFAAMVFPIAALKPRWLPYVLVMAVAYGGAIEVVQPYVGRYRDWSDWLADIVGVAAGSAAGLLLNRHFVSQFISPTQ